MSVNHAMTTQSLPSFAQAFSNHSLSTIAPANHALPPIHPRVSPMDQPQRSPPVRSLSRPGSEEDAARTAGRKRPHTDIISGSRDDVPPDTDRASPNAVRVKEEHDQVMLDVSPPPPVDLRPPPQDSTGAPAPSSTMPSPMKRRRMTVTGAPHALNIDVRVPPAEANSTPISPVVMGFTIQRDNLKEIEQVKSMVAVKQKQKALIEQRRGSLAGPAVANSILPPPTSVEGPSNVKSATGPLRTTRRSPNGGAGVRRTTATSISSQSGVNRAPSPNPSTFQLQQSVQLPHQSAQTLPPPPISFARRRAAQMGTKRKPADIMISPRERESPEQFQPSIQSAPPTQGAFYTGRHPMALPRLPNVMNSAETLRRPTGHVPPTPTRLSQRMSNPIAPPSIHVEGTRSPMPSIPIASSLVPPTPAFHQTEHSASGDKVAFLAPFAQFYDALNDSKQLKTWLGDQLQRATSLCHTWSQQQQHQEEIIETIIDRKLSSMHSEVTSLRRRVLELEEALREANGRRVSTDVGPPYHTKSLQNGYSSSSHLSPESYTFPSTSSDHSRLRSDLSARVSSPRGHERDVRGMQLEPERDSSVPFDSRRAPASALRLEPPRSHHDTSSLPPPSHTRISHPMQSPPPLYRDSPPSHSLQPPSNSHGKTRDRPPLPRQLSHDREHAEASMPRRTNSRRSPPDQRMEES